MGYGDNKDENKEMYEDEDEYKLKDKDVSKDKED